MHTFQISIYENLLTHVPIILQGSSRKNKTLNENKLMSEKCVLASKRKKNIKLIMDECLRQYDSIMGRKCAVARGNIYKPQKMRSRKFHNFSNGFCSKTFWNVEQKWWINDEKVSISPKLRLQKNPWQNLLLKWGAE